MQKFTFIHRFTEILVIFMAFLTIFMGKLHENDKRGHLQQEITV